MQCYLPVFLYLFEAFKRALNRLEEVYISDIISSYLRLPLYKYDATITPQISIIVVNSSRKRFPHVMGTSHLQSGAKCWTHDPPLPFGTKLTDPPLNVG